MNKRILSMVMAMLMIITCLVSPAMAAPAEPQTSESLAPAAIEQPSRETADGEYSVMRWIRFVSCKMHEGIVYFYCRPNRINGKVRIGAVSAFSSDSNTECVA